MTDYTLRTAMCELKVHQVRKVESRPNAIASELLYKLYELFTLQLIALRAMCSPLRLLVSIWFQIYFTVLSDYFSPFPHGTSSLSISKSI